ncbi:Phenylalanine--tRNA ligase alpha subunit [Buchnera aphidicola (Sipha maydis)]|uniref:phenylalanine--tRNA ligase subunit alpha n=1 Tax=Buchnera aphidicola TaxID=9 RepID=UPI003463A0D3
MCIKTCIQDILYEIDQCKSIYELNLVKTKYLGKKGYIFKQIKRIKKLNIHERKKFSIKINKIKKTVVNQIYWKKKNFLALGNKLVQEKKMIDVSLSSQENNYGSLHIVTQTVRKIKSFFSKLGCKIVFGPEIEHKYYNFDALNVQKNHPSRNFQDTFWFNKNYLLRTQTSSVQIRVMEKEKPPIKILVPGKVYRNDSDLTHSPMFHQIEGLIVDKKINFSNLKWMMENFLLYFFEDKIKIRFRNSYFPFTTPSMEVDIFNKKSKEWLEVLGCGMVHPFVFNNVNIDISKYSGCAFGIGIERIIMLKYEISNIRSFFKNDLRLLRQFK